MPVGFSFPADIDLWFPLVLTEDDTNPGQRGAHYLNAVGRLTPGVTVAQAYDVFNEDAGFANRGTFVVDRSGIIRFAEMKQPGEARDQAVWTEALTSLGS